MNRETFERLAREALKEVLGELAYPSAGRGRLCELAFFPPPQDRDEMEYCLYYSDGRPGMFRICLSKDLTDELAKAELKRQLLEHGVVPGVSYARPG